MVRRTVSKTVAPFGDGRSIRLLSSMLCKRGRIRLAAPVCKTGTSTRTLQVRILPLAPYNSHMIETMVEKKCTKCGRSEPEVSFDILDPKTRPRKRSYCNKCRYAQRKNRLGPSMMRELWIKKEKERSTLRKSNQKTEVFIYADCRKYDRKHGLDNDLDLEYIAALIGNGCMYCGERNLRMTLDRIDNSLGHIKSNVNPACIRCNYLRRDMPYAAWVIIAYAVRQAASRGAFGRWTGRTN